MWKKFLYLKIIRTGYYNNILINNSICINESVTVLIQFIKTDRGRVKWMSVIYFLFIYLFIYNAIYIHWNNIHYVKHNSLISHKFDVQC